MNYWKTYKGWKIGIRDDNGCYVGVNPETLECVEHKYLYKVKQSIRLINRINGGGVQ
jgi:hypothetical protein